MYCFTALYQIYIAETILPFNIVDFLLQSGDIMLSGRSTLGNIRNKLKALKIPGRDRTEKASVYEEPVIEENGLNGSVSSSPNQVC